jgi:hypothetical protein
MYKHPFCYNIVEKTDYYYYNNGIGEEYVRGRVKWRTENFHKGGSSSLEHLSECLNFVRLENSREREFSPSEYIHQGLLYLVIDDAIGQFNKTIHPIGVTLYLDVSFLSHDIRRDSDLTITCRVDKTRISSKGKIMSLCKVKCKNDDEITVATAESLFILDKIKPAIRLDGEFIWGKEIKILRYGDLVKDSLFKLYHLQSLNFNPNMMFEIRKRSPLSASPCDQIIFYDGQGPPNHVHGGIIGYGLMEYLTRIASQLENSRVREFSPLEYLNQIRLKNKSKSFNLIHINYKSLTPFNKKIDIVIEDKSFRMLHKEECLCEGTFW